MHNAMQRVMPTFAPVGTVGEIGRPDVEAFVLLFQRPASFVVVGSLWCHGAAGCTVLVSQKRNDRAARIGGEGKFLVHASAPGLAAAEAGGRRWARPLLSPKRDSIASCFPTRK